MSILISNTYARIAQHFKRNKQLYIKMTIALSALFSLGIVCTSFVVLQISNTLPSEKDIRSTDLRIPLRIYSSNKKLIAEFGNERRKPLSIKNTPESLIHAILASEDDRFFEHAGVDLFGIARAVIANARSGGTQQGASTITMQVARNYFLTREKTYTRKLREVMLAFKLETNLSKEEILQLYINKIFLGHRSYGFAAAAEVYFGKEIDELTLSEQAVLAGLPKAPSRDNPISNPERSKKRRDYVLGRMLEEKWINQIQHDEAITNIIKASKHGRKAEVNAPFVAEMVRSKLLAEFGEDVYWKGWHVYTTIDSNAQQAANNALRQGLLSYDRRHGFRGKIDTISLNKSDPPSPDKLSAILSKHQPSGEIIPAIILSSNPKFATAFTLNKEIIELNLNSVKWAKKQVSTESVGAAPTKVDNVLSVGDVIYVRKKPAPVDTNKAPFWELSQLPQIQGALISISPKSGKIIALNGGFDFYFNKYNRVTQARRQPGSGIKPFIYAAALEKGYSPASIISGAPIVSVDESSGTLWRPQNYSGEFFGPTSLRKALTKSMNTVSVRLLRSIDIDYTKQFLGKFGLPENYLPKSLSLALGAGNLTPLEIANAYASLANTGYLVEPYIIEKITDRNGKEIFSRPKIQLCNTCDINSPTTNKAPRIMSKEANFQIVNMMQDVVTNGTARKALSLKRSDLAGKTGTTNDYVDAWFSGFTPSITTTVWVGFDKPQTMGRSESGGKAALPIWINFMKEALSDTPEQSYTIPAGIIVKRDPITDKTEYFSSTSEFIPEPGYNFQLNNGNPSNDNLPIESNSSPIDFPVSDAVVPSLPSNTNQDLF